MFNSIKIYYFVLYKKKIDSCYIKSSIEAYQLARSKKKIHVKWKVCLRFNIFLKFKTNHGHTHCNKIKKPRWRQLPISKSLLQQDRRDNNSGELGADLVGVLVMMQWPTLRKKCPYSELFWSAFPRIWLNTERYGASLRIQSEYGKIRTRITPNTDTFHAVEKV